MNVFIKCKNRLKEIDNKNCTCYYFDDIMRAWDIDIDTDFSGILSYKKFNKEKNENISVYDISYKP